MAACGSDVRGYVHVYTGDGKGKTSAAMGLVARALGRGRRVFVAQFLKHAPSGETLLFGSLPNADCARFGLPRSARDPIRAADREAARAGIAACADALRSDRYDLVVLDELCVVVGRGVATVEAALELVALRPPRCELVLTGRGAHPAIIAAADLVTEMREVKHYYQAGVPAREGVEY